MFERVGFGSCPTTTPLPWASPPPSPRRDFNLKHDLRLPASTVRFTNGAFQKWI